MWGHKRGTSEMHLQHQWHSASELSCYLSCNLRPPQGRLGVFIPLQMSWSDSKQSLSFSSWNAALLQTGGLISCLQRSVKVFFLVFCSKVIAWGCYTGKGWIKVCAQLFDFISRLSAREEAQVKHWVIIEVHIWKSAWNHQVDATADERPRQCVCHVRRGGGHRSLSQSRIGDAVSR